MFKLKTKRLLLRHFEMADLEEIYGQVFSDAESMHFGEGPQTRAWAEHWIEKSIEHYKDPALVLLRLSSKAQGN